MEDNNPSIVPGDDDVASSEDENVSTPDALEQINKASGRNYKSLDEALGGVKETFSFVGKKAAPKDVAPQPKPENGLQEEVKKLQLTVEKNDFLNNNPEAKEYADEIGALAQSKGVSWQEAYDNSRIKSLVKEKYQAGEETPMVATGQRLHRSQNVDVNSDTFHYLSPEEQRKMVERMPTWNKPFKDTTWNKANKPRNYDI
jgi:hypothetical protein